MTTPTAPEPVGRDEKPCHVHDPGDDPARWGDDLAAHLVDAHGEDPADVAGSLYPDLIACHDYHHDDHHDESCPNKDAPQEGHGATTVALDPAQREHLDRAPWLQPTPHYCTCRTDADGNRYYTCRRVACAGKGLACGAYCITCFQQRMAVPPRPEVVVLCGSTRFPEAWRKAQYDLTLAGKIVLTIGCDTKSDEGLGITPEQKVALDELHKRKIDMADRVLVLNVDNYIGESTRSEIAYAKWWEKPIDYLEPGDQNP